MTPRKPGSNRGGQDRVCADLRALAAGMADGGRLPSITELAARSSVSQTTAYRAALKMEAQGVISMSRGHGLFARHFRPVLRLASQRLRRSQWLAGPGIQAADAGGRVARVDRVVVERLPWPPPVAAELGPGPVIERSRRYLLDKVPVMTSVAWYPYRIVAGTAIEADDTGPGGAYARLAEVGHAPAAFTESVTARAGTEGEVRDLGLPRHLPIVIQVTRLAQDDAGQVVEVSVIVLDARQYTLVYEVEA